MVVVQKCFGQLLGSAGSIASKFSAPQGVTCLLTILCFSELAEPQKLLPYILQPDITKLSPEIIAVYIQAATKIFGHWAAESAQQWDDNDLPEVKGIVDLILVRVRELVSSPHIEVQERVRSYRFLTMRHKSKPNFHRQRIPCNCSTSSRLT
jgi:hypothetical protein